MRLFFYAIIFFLSVSSQVAARELAGSDFVENINFLYLKGDYKSLVKSTDINLSRLRLNRKDKKEVTYLTGLSHLKLGNYTRARELFASVGRMRGDEFRDDARISSADSYFKEKNYKKAIEMYSEILNSYSAGERLSGIYYNLALSYRETGETKKADMYLREIKELYGSSFEADIAPHVRSRRNEQTFYIVQLGAFRSIRNAKKLVKKLSRKKYDSYIQKYKKDSKVLYRVRGGKFSNERYAKRLVRKLRRDGFPTKIIEE